MKLRIFTVLPLAAGLTGVLASGVVGAALAPLSPLPAYAQKAGKGPGNGNGKGPFQGGNNGNGPNPSRGNAGRNSGTTTVSNSVMVPRIRFAPPAPVSGTTK